MIWLWRYLSGFLTIILSGENAEKVLNLASKNGIYLWNLRCKKGNIIGNIGIKNFIKLRYIKRGIKCRIRIIEKRGLVFKTNKYIHRTGFFIGIFLFFSVIFILSNFIWIINIEGNYSIKSSEILSACKKINIYEGISKKKINTKYDAQRLMLQQKQISWCSLNIEGCVLTINLTEAEATDKDKRQNPSNLKSIVEGKIKKIDVTSGNTLVKVGDTVSKGELLVSGVIENLSSTQFVHSEGSIIAETKRTFSAEGKYTQNISLETGKCTTHYTTQFFNLKIPFFLGNIKKEYNYNSNVKTLTLFDKKIPIKIASEQYLITQNTTVNYDQTTLEDILYEDIKKQVENMNFIAATEFEREVVKTDKGMLLKISYNCEENIAKQDEIILSKVN